MPTIPNFPQSLLEEHKNWHHARHNMNLDPPPGYGLEFLRYHRDFTARALAWYYRNGYDPRLVEAWASVPEPIRQAPCYNHAAEARILFQPETFASADELGRFIESSNIHSCIHQESAKLFGDPAINDFDTAPRNTVFYNIHGMVDRWWRNWEGLGRFRVGRRRQT
ncbi:tyrosinase family protein [Cohnella luojiensis]|nr:tyrosinase family protein [Cohnella luojiensis]